MPIKYYNPTSAGRRAGSVLDYRSEITKTEPEKSLLEPALRTPDMNEFEVQFAGYLDSKQAADSAPMWEWDRLVKNVGTAAISNGTMKYSVR